MLTIIKKTKEPGGFYLLQSQSGRKENWIGEEWAVVPDHIHITSGYGDATFEGGYLVGWVQGTPPKPDPDTTVQVEELTDYADSYADLVIAGGISITDVPADYRQAVQEEVNKKLKGQ